MSMGGSPQPDVSPCILRCRRCAWDVIRTDSIHEKEKNNESRDIFHRSIERDSEDLIRIGFDGRLFLIGRTAVKATGTTSDSPTERLLDLAASDVESGAEMTIDASDVDCAAGRFAAAVWREDGNGEPENR